MITRTAIFEGRIKEGQEETFFKEVRETLLPLWRQFPNAQNVRYQRVVGVDEGAPEIAMIQQIDYPSMDDVEAIMTSPIRTKARAATMQLMEIFDGRFYHVLSEPG